VLPGSVALVLSDGTVSQQATRWPRLTRQQLASTRPYDIEGELVHGPRGAIVRVTAHVTPFTVASVQSFTAAVPVGVAPFLPSQATITFSDRVTEDVRVAWDPVPAGALQRPGSFSLRGDLAGLPERGLRTSVAVTVSDAYTAGQNLAPDAAPSASFSGSPDTVPASLNNGVIVDPKGWSNQYLKQATALLPAFSLAQPADWVSLTWTAPQALDTLVPYFRLAAGRALPAAVAVEYWNGRAFVPVGHPSVTWATASDQPTTIRFDKIATTQIRLIMTSAAPGTPNGFVQISELQALGDRPKSAAARSAITSEDVAAEDSVDQTEAPGCAIVGDSPVPLVVGLLALAGRRGRRTRAARETTPPRTGDRS
jgi:beta-galactosidase